MGHWGVVSTVKAPLSEVVKFVAHHLSMGAQYFVIYLDQPDAAVLEYFRDDPDIKIIPTEDSHWTTLGHRPKSIEGRQVFNINHAIDHVRDIRPSIQWLAHFDIDEFIVNHAANLTIAQKLKRIPDDVLSVQVKPIENLIAPNGTLSPIHHFKALMYPYGRRARLSSEIYPEFGDRIIGGFLSHKNGKSIFRVTNRPVFARIHYVSNDEAEKRNPKDTVHLRGYELAHYHSKPWDQFEPLYHERRETGSYRTLNKGKQMRRAGLSPLWDVFTEIENTEGIDGIRRMHQALCIATPDLLARLENFHLLRSFDMQFDAKIARYFPDLDLPTARIANAD